MQLKINEFRYKIKELKSIKETQLKNTSEFELLDWKLNFIKLENEQVSKKFQVQQDDFWIMRIQHEMLKTLNDKVLQKIQFNQQQIQRINNQQNHFRFLWDKKSTKKIEKEKTIQYKESYL